MRELMSKWGYVIGVREPIGGDRCLRNSKESNHIQHIGKKLCLGGRCLWGNG